MLQKGEGRTNRRVEHGKRKGEGKNKGRSSRNSSSSLPLILLLPLRFRPVSHANVSERFSFSVHFSTSCDDLEIGNLTDICINPGYVNNAKLQKYRHTQRNSPFFTFSSSPSVCLSHRYPSSASSISPSFRPSLQDTRMLHLPTCERITGTAKSHTRRTETIHERNSGWNTYSDAKQDI